MDRITLRIPAEQLDQLEQLVDRGEYPSRSEAIRAGIRELVDDSPAFVVATDGPPRDEPTPRDWRNR